MSNELYTRRQAMRLGLGGLSGLALLNLAACGGAAASGASTETLQMSFWGNASRNKLTRNAIQAFQKKYTNLAINSWYVDFTTYFNKLNTQIAGGSAPDLIQMDMSYLAAFDKQHLLLDLMPYINDKTIDMSNFDQGMMKSSEDNGVPYGISLGGNYECLVYDTTLVQQAGVGAPAASMTWEEFGTYAGKLSHALAGQKIVGVVDASGYMDLFEIWVRQRGKELWTPAGKINFTVDDAASWFSYWSGLRNSGACVSAEVQAAVTGSGAATSLLTKGKAVFDITHSNQFVGFQALTKHILALQQVPSGTGPGLFLKPSMLLSISANSKHAKEGAQFINFLINDPEGIKAIGLDRGVPGKASSQTVLQPILTATDKTVLTYFNAITSGSQVTGKTVLDPPGAGKVIKALSSVAQQVGFKKLSETAGAQAFVQQTQQALV